MNSEKNECRIVNVNEKNQIVAEDAHVTNLENYKHLQK
jgi:hypothetical protein